MHSSTNSRRRAAFRWISSYVAAIAIGAISPPASHANQVWMSRLPEFCGFHDGVYAIDEQVTVCGNWDEYDFPCPIGDVYIIVNRSSYYQGLALSDAMGSENAVQGCGGGGSFFDAPIAQPPLPLGKYDVVLDENQNGLYDVGADLVLGDGSTYAFEVVHESLGTLIDGQAIKDAAFENAWSWFVVGEASTRLLSAALGSWEKKALQYPITMNDLVVFASRVADANPQSGKDIQYNLLVDYSAEEIPPPRIRLFASGVGHYADYLGVGVHMIRKIHQSQAQVYLDIYNDPPDPDFRQVVRVDPIGYRLPLGPTELHRRHIHFANLIEQQNAVGTAMRRSFEKFLGASDSTENQWARLHMEATLEYAMLCVGLIDTSRTILSGIRADVDSVGLSMGVFDGDTLSILQARVGSEGFTSGELSQMAAVGMTPEEIDTLRAILLDMDPLALDDLPNDAGLDSLASALARTSDSLASFIAELEWMQALLRNVTRRHPIAVVAAPAKVGEGVVATLSGAASTDPQADPLTYRWDLDGDGSFTDATGVEVTHVWEREQWLLVGLEVLDDTGREDVGYRLIEITDVNDGPVFKTVFPETVFVDSAQTPIAFAVSCEDPDGDSIRYDWYVNDSAVAVSDSALEWVPLPGVSVVRVDVSDGSSLSPDNRWVWRIRSHSTVNVDDAGGEFTETEMALGAIWPNPTRGGARFSLSVPTPQEVRVDVVDILGRVVRNIVRGKVSAGRHEFVWDGRNEAGREAASGVYVLRLQAPGRMDTKRLVLLR